MLQVFLLLVSSDTCEEGKSCLFPCSPAQLLETGGKLSQGDEHEVVWEACCGAEQGPPRCEGCSDQQTSLPLADLFYKLAFSKEDKGKTKKHVLSRSWYGRDVVSTPVLVPASWADRLESVLLPSSTHSSSASFEQLHLCRVLLLMPAPGCC